MRCRKKNEVILWQARRTATWDLLNQVRVCTASAADCQNARLTLLRRCSGSGRPSRNPNTIPYIVPGGALADTDSIPVCHGSYHQPATRLIVCWRCFQRWSGWVRSNRGCRTVHLAIEERLSRWTHQEAAPSFGIG